MPRNIGLIWAFLGGLVSFLSPCVLPLIPGYLSYVSGLSIDEIRGASPRVLPHMAKSSLLFVAGFSFVFVGLGASASFVGSLLSANKELLTRAAGVLVILFGVSVTGLVRIPVLSRSAAQGRGRLGPPRPWASVALGMSFAVAWTPCVGPILAAILAFAGATATVKTGMALLFTYSLGLGLPFVVTALLFGRMTSLLSLVKRNYQAVAYISGALLIIMGILLLTDEFALMGNFLRKYQFFQLNIP